MIRTRLVIRWLCSLLLLAACASAADSRVQLIASGRIDDAIARLRADSQKNPKDAESLHLLSRAYFALEQWDAAISSNEAAIAMQPNNSGYHTWMGRQYGQKADSVSFFSAPGFARKAKVEFERAVQLNGSSVEARKDLAEYYIEAPAIMGGGLDKARAQADALAHLDPPSSHWVLARVAEKQKRFDEAEREFKAAIAASTEPARYWLNLASFYRGRGRLDDMEKAVVAATKVPKRHPSVLFDAASVLLRGGRNLEGAVQYLREDLSSGQFLEDAPAFQAHYLMGQILEKLGRRTEAAAAYRQALSLASGFERARGALKRVS